MKLSGHSPYNMGPIAGSRGGRGAEEGGEGAGGRPGLPPPAHPASPSHQHQPPARQASNSTATCQTGKYLYSHLPDRQLPVSVPCFHSVAAPPPLGSVFLFFHHQLFKAIFLLVELSLFCSGEPDTLKVNIVLETSLLLVNLELCQNLLHQTDIQLHVPRLVLQVTSCWVSLEFC